MNATQPATAALIGLGKLGLTVARGLTERRDLRIIAAADRDPGRVGRDLGELLGGAPLGVRVGADLPDAPKPDIVFLMTGSRIGELGEAIEALGLAGMNVITSAEELAYPWREFPAWSDRLDAAAKQGGVSVMGAGVNPGFLMDALPILLSGVSQNVERIAMKRTMDLRPHRPERLARFGLGLSPAEYAAAGGTTIYGHVGFRQSIDAVADALGWPRERKIEEERPEPVIVATAPRLGKFARIDPGEVAVVRQGARGAFAGEPLISLEEHFGFVDDDDPIPMGDQLTLECSDQSFTIDITPGLFSFASTPAVLLNLARPLIEAAPGLVTTADLPVRGFSSQGGALPRRSQLA